ncbi:hypothetical protein RCL1_001731 [Eukaryota sp. TZLM3-RCL]
MFKSGQFVGDFVTINTNLSCFFKSFKSQEQKTLFFSTMFKSGQFVGDFVTINTNLSGFFKSFKSQEQKTLFFSNTLFFHVFSQGILKFQIPLFRFNLYNSQLEFRNKDFSTFATKLISISGNFRNVIFRAVELVCGSGGHCLQIVIDLSDFDLSDFDPIISSQCTCTSQLSTPSVVYLKLLKKFPITSLLTTTLNFDTRILDTEKVTQLELNYFNEQLSAITLFPNLSCFCLSDSGVVHDFSLLAPCRNLCSISLTRCSAFDLTQFSNIEQLTSLSLYDVDVTDFSPLSTFKGLTELSLDECTQFPNLISGDISNALDSNRITDISFLSTCIKLKSLSFDRSEVADLSPLSLLSNTLRSLSLNNSLFPNLCQLSNFKQLEFLSLNSNNITDICPLSSLQNLTNLSLYNTKVSDLSSLQYLSKLSFLDVRKTLLSHEYHRRVSGLSCVQEFLNSFTVHRVDFSITNRKRTCSSELSLKKSR